MERPSNRMGEVVLPIGIGLADVLVLATSTSESLSRSLPYLSALSALLLLVLCLTYLFKFMPTKRIILRERGVIERQRLGRISVYIGIVANMALFVFGSDQVIILYIAAILCICGGLMSVAQSRQKSGHKDTTGN